MWARCSLVSRRFDTLAAAPLPWSGDDEQPARKVTASAAPNTPLNKALSRTCARQLRPMPPAAAKGLEQCRGVGETVRLGFDEAESRLLVRLLGIQHGKIGRIAVLVLKSGKVEARLRRVGSCRRGFKRIGILPQRDQRVGD